MEISWAVVFTSPSSHISLRTRWVIVQKRNNIHPADSKADISIDDMINADTMELVQEILTAYTVVIDMVNEFFKTPDVEPKQEEEEGNKGKN